MVPNAFHGFLFHFHLHLSNPHRNKWLGNGFELILVRISASAFMSSKVEYVHKEEEFICVAANRPVNEMLEQQTSGVGTACDFDNAIGQTSELEKANLIETKENDLPSRPIPLKRMQSDPGHQSFYDAKDFDSPRSSGVEKGRERAHSSGNIGNGSSSMYQNRQQGRYPHQHSFRLPSATTTDTRKQSPKYALNSTSSRPQSLREVLQDRTLMDDVLIGVNAVVNVVMGSSNPSTPFESLHDVETGLAGTAAHVHDTGDIIETFNCRFFKLSGAWRALIVSCCSICFENRALSDAFHPSECTFNHTYCLPCMSAYATVLVS